FLSALIVTALAPLPCLAQDLILPAGSTWSYLDNGSNQGTAWQQVGFNDSAWSTGTAQFGYGDGDETTIISFGPSSVNKYITTYFRTSFNVPNPAIYGSLGLRLLRDDGAVVYLNGSEIARSNLPNGTVTSSTTASSAQAGGEEDNFAWFTLDPALLQTGSNLVAVELHQSSGSSSDTSFDLELQASSNSTLVSRGPYLQQASSTAQVVRWRTTSSSTGRVWIGSSPSTLGVWVDDTITSNLHAVEVSGLQPATRYYYAVGTTAGILAGGDIEHTFRTPPVIGTREPVRMWVIGDSGTSDSSAALVRNSYANYPGADETNLWLMLGDNAYNEGNGAEYQAAVFDFYPSMLRRSSLWTTRGNHEATTFAYYDIFTMPMAGEAGGIASGTEAYYSFDYANIHFVCLDSYVTSRAVGGAMWLWLQSDLAATTQDWIIAFWHHPPYTKGSHDSDTETRLVEMRQNFLPLLEDHGVDLVLGGHSHSFERSYLIDGHYGTSGTLSPSMILDDGDGSDFGDGAYNRPAGNHVGTVYCVAGSSGKIGGGPLNHPAMFYSINALGSLVIDVDGGRLDVRFLRSTGAVSDHFTLLDTSYSGSYCTATPHSGNCKALMSSAGTPSATSPLPFLVQCANVLSGQFGILFYGYAPAHTPFSTGLRCVTNPIIRTPPQPAGGSAPCLGSFQIDFNPLIQAPHDAGLVPGATVYSQYWFRDPGSPTGTGLSNGLQFVIQP
ncbi:MAG: metallophosphoesterase family protein, partial [bacterium]